MWPQEISFLVLLWSEVSQRQIEERYVPWEETVPKMLKSKVSWETSWRTKEYFDRVCNSLRCCVIAGSLRGSYYSRFTLLIVSACEINVLLRGSYR